MAKGTIMATNMNSVNPPNHDLIKDTQDQKNCNCGVRFLENSPQVIIPQPIFKNLVNKHVIAKEIGNISIIKNHVDFSLKVKPRSSVKLYPIAPTRRIRKEYNGIHLRLILPLTHSNINKSNFCPASQPQKF